MPPSSLQDILRPELAELSAYVPHPGSYAIRLDANEAPGLLSEKARARLAAEAAEISFQRYPDASTQSLREALAARSGVRPEEVLVGVGSDELIALLITALSKPRAGADAPLVLTTTPTFVMYAMSAKVRGQRVLEVPLDSNWDLALPSMLSALRVLEPNIIFLASPNNPTGNKYSPDRLRTLIQATPRSLVVIDEAYIDYSAENQLGFYREFENVAILRTLSKVGFAALRVGWLIARPELVREIDKVRLPYNMPTVSQRLAAIVVGDLSEEITRATKLVISERERMTRELSLLSGVTVTPSQSNFLWIESKRSAAELFEGLLARSILVRSFHQRGGRLARQLRVTIGSREENDALLSALRALV